MAICAYREVALAASRQRMVRGQSSWAFVLSTLICVCAAGLGIQAAGFAEWLEEKLGRSLLFEARSLLGRDPAIPASIKIFSFDDSAASFVGSTSLTLPEWGAVLAAIAAKKPRVILVDKIFDAPASESDIAAFRRALGENDVPIVAGGFVQDAPITGRTVLAGEGFFHARSLLGIGKDSPLKYGYGPLPALLDSFAAVGHLQIEGQFQHLYFDIGSGRILAAAGLAAAATDATERERLAAVGALIQPVLIDLAHPSLYHAKSFSMRAVVSRTRKGKDISAVTAGDVVIVLPAMYTGNTDWKSSVHGMIPGGYVLAAGAASAMRGDWLRLMPAPALLLGLATMWGCGLALLTTGLRFWLGVSASVLGLVAVALGAFVLGGIVMPWIMPTLLMVMAAATIFIDRARIARDVAIKMAAELATAKLVQESFFRAATTRTDVLTVAAVVQPADECSGDWWWYHSSGDYHYVIVGDAVGHGIPAALVTAMAFAVVQTAFDGGAAPTPSAILRLLNRTIASAKSRFGSMSMIVCRINVVTMRLEFANPAHNPFYLLVARDDDPRLPRQRGKSMARLRTMTISGSLLGLDADADFGEGVLDLAKGDQLIFYTDGVTENQGADGSQWGVRGLVKELAQAAAHTAEETTAAMEAKIRAFHGSAPWQDDWTFVVAQVGATE